MMNRYHPNYDTMGSRGRAIGRGGVSPYRQPPMRGDLPMRSDLSRQGFNRPGSGCGCGGGLARRQSPDPTRETREAASRPAEGGCGCGGGSARCNKLMEQIRAVDFALYETVLYLDVYPHSCDALETYRKLRARSEELHAEYESVCGPLTALGIQSDTSWDWMSKPFPWEYDAD